MASVYDDIRSAFEVALNSVSGVPSIAWENVSFSPTTGQSYVTARLVPQSCFRGLLLEEYLLPALPPVSENVCDNI